MENLPLGDNADTSLKIAMASPDVAITDAFFSTASLNASTGSCSVTPSLEGIWNRISDKLTAESSLAWNSSATSFLPAVHC